MCVLSVPRQEFSRRIDCQRQASSQYLLPRARQVLTGKIWSPHEVRDVMCLAQGCRVVGAQEMFVSFSPHFALAILLRQLGLGHFDAALPSDALEADEERRASV